MPPEFKKVVVPPDTIATKHLTPKSSQYLLGRRRWSLKFLRSIEILRRW